MLISWKWLGSLVDLEGLTPEEVGERLTLAGLELEGIEAYGQRPALASVVVGHILSIEPHPSADKLVVCQVDVGEGAPRQIVCGAKNMKSNDKVPVALPGTVMPGGLEIAVSALRGVESQGMLCSARELELSHDHEGLMILPPTLPLGAPVLEALELADTVLDVSLTPNRPDALSHMGLSREVAAVLGRPRTWPALLDAWRLASRGEGAAPGELALEGVSAGASVTELVGVALEDAEGCPRYGLAAMTDLVVGPSPPWLRARLMAIGQRPINNLVDVTNYILHECGQPIHAFDLDKLRGGVIRVRRAQEGEVITTIDGQERALLPDDVVIADGEGPVAVAGVMGGGESGVSASTTRIAIECAYFNPTRVRRTGRRLGLHTESSHRFERGVDPNAVPWVLRRTVELIAETQRYLGATPRLAAGFLDAYPAPIEAREVRLPVARYAEVIGVPLDGAALVETLERLDLRSHLEGDVVVARVPTFRPDIERDVDLVEEVARVRGLEEIPALLPPGLMGFAHAERADGASRHDTLVTREAEEAVRRLRQTLLARGLFEAVNYSFIASSDLERMGFGEDDVRRWPIAVRNPLSEAMNVMRTTLLPGLLRNLQTNRAHQRHDAALFEVARVYLRDGDPRAALPAEVGGHRWGLHAEPLHAAAVLVGQEPHHFAGTRSQDPWGLLGLARDVVSVLTRQPPTLAPWEAPPALLHPRAAAKVQVGGVEVGWVGAIHPDVVEAFELSGAVYAFEVDVDRLLAVRQPLPKLRAIPRFPAATRDFALVVRRELPWAEVEAALASFGDPRLVASGLFDVYQGEQLGADRKSLAVRVTLQDPEATLGEEDLAGLHRSLAEHLQRTLDAQLRA